MIVHNIRDTAEQMTFTEAARQGSGHGGGLFMPEQWPHWEDLPDLLTMPLRELWRETFTRLFDDEIPPAAVRGMVDSAFSFPLPLKQVTERIWVLELFHGPTLAFKDFGARFLAQVLAWHRHIQRQTGPLTLLTATSGDTGAAVAHAFHGLEGIQAVILYPAGRVSPSQEKLIATLGDNIHTLRVAGSFDDCQTLIKQCFADASLSRDFGLTSANSINIGRLLAQISFYLGGVSLFFKQARGQGLPVISVPCGNFGNLTAGLLAQRLGLPVKRFLIATNRNDVVPRFLTGDHFVTRPSFPTPANAMDVGAPNNWERIRWLFAENDHELRSSLSGGSVEDTEIYAAMRTLDGFGYTADPHGAVAYQLLEDQLAADETGIFLETAHPAKFPEVYATAVGKPLTMPDELLSAEQRPLQTRDIANTREAVVQALHQCCNH